MRSFITLTRVALLLSLSCLAGCGQTYPTARAMVRVVHDQKPMAKAHVTANLYHHTWAGTKTKTLSGSTNGKGLFKIVLSGGPILSLEATKPGFYKSYGSKRFTSASFCTYKPYNPTIEIVMRKIQQPIPMYARILNYDDFRNLATATTYYDTTAGDLVAPFGRGQVKDIELHWLKKGFGRLLSVKFLRDGDGIQEMNPYFQRCEFKSPYEAPLEGYTKEILIYRKSSNQPAPEGPAYGYYSQFIFRVRSIYDDQGNLVSALYGKVYSSSSMFEVFTNPTPMSRNLEFDPKKNLLKDDFTRARDLPWKP